MNPFLIVGCQRSGTTMLRLALGVHPEITCHDEQNSYRMLLAADTPPGNGFKIPRWTDLIPGPTLGDSDQGLETAWTYRGETLVGIYRNPADVVASMAALQMGKQTWLERYGEALLVQRLGRSSVDRLRSDGGRWAIGAAYWRAKNEALVSLREAGYPITLVSYEALVADPEPTLRGLLDFIGTYWHPDVLDHSHAAGHKDIEPDGLATGRTDPSRPIDERSVGRGATLPTHALDTIHEIAGDLHARLARVAVRS